MYKLDKAGNFIKFKNGKSIKPGAIASALYAYIAS